MELSETQKAARAAAASAPAPAPKVQNEEKPKVEFPPRPEHHTTAMAAQIAETPAKDQPFTIKKELDQDSPDAQPTEGTTCKRSACKQQYHRSMERSDEECIFHPGVPIFHEGSKVALISLFPGLKAKLTY